MSHSRRVCILTNANAYYSIPLFISSFEYLNFCYAFDDDEYDLVVLKDNMYLDFIRESEIFNSVKIHGDSIDYTDYQKVVRYEIKSKFKVNDIYENASSVFGYPYKDPFNINDQRLKHLECKYILMLEKIKHKNFIIINLSCDLIKKFILSDIDILHSLFVIDINSTGLINGSIGLNISSFDELFLLLLHASAVYTIDSAIANLSAFMGINTWIYFPSCNEKSIMYPEDGNVKYFGKEPNVSIQKSFFDITRIRFS